MGDGPVFVIGDVHGQLEKLIALLRDGGLIGADWSWRGGTSALWLMGDLVDRGPDGIAVIDLAMRLQREAAMAGGRVGVLFGNHDGLLVGTARFGERPLADHGWTFRGAWLQNGGALADLERLTPEHVRWLTSLPAMTRVGDTLLVHADALFYLHYGGTIDEVNRAFAALLHSDDALRWDRLMGEFSEHRAFVDGAAGAERAATFLCRFGGRQLVHGHSPISAITRQPPVEVREALVYADGLCVDVDGGMYRGGPGFVYRLPERDGQSAARN